MVVATHIVKIRGTFDRDTWNEKKLKKYVRRKIICEIDDSFHTHLNLFKIDNDDDSGHKGRIDIWVYLYALPSGVDKEAIEKWIYDHIIEEGLVVEEFEFSMITDTTKDGWKEMPFINMSWIAFDDMDDEERKLYHDKCDEKWKKQCEIDKEYYSNKEKRKKEEGVSHRYSRQ